MSPNDKIVDVCVETGEKRVFVSALDWPGWTRSGKDEKAALEKLAAYAPRYAAVPRTARIAFPAAEPRFKVVERVKGNATTDFGAPATPPKEGLQNPATARFPMSNGSPIS